MALERKSDTKEIIDVLKKMSGDNRRGAKNPSTDAVSTFGPKVSLVRNVSVSPIIVLNCLLLF